MLWTIFIFNKWKRYQRSDIKYNGQRYLLLRCYDISKPSFSFRYQLKRLCGALSWLVSLVPVGTLLQRLKLVGFIYVTVKRRKNISDRSTLLMYQLRRRDDVSTWSRTFKLVTKMGQFLLGTKAVYFSGTSSGSVTLKYHQRLKDVGLI